MNHFEAGLNKIDCYKKKVHAPKVRLKIFFFLNKIGSHLGPGRNLKKIGTRYIFGWVVLVETNFGGQLKSSPS